MSICKIAPVLVQKGVHLFQWIYCSDKSQGNQAGRNQICEILPTNGEIVC